MSFNTDFSTMSTSCLFPVDPHHGAAPAAQVSVLFVPAPLQMAQYGAAPAAPVPVVFVPAPPHMAQVCLDACQVVNAVRAHVDHLAQQQMDDLCSAFVNVHLDDPKEEQMNQTIQDLSQSFEGLGIHEGLAAPTAAPTDAAPCFSPTDAAPCFSPTDAAPCFSPTDAT